MRIESYHRSCLLLLTLGCFPLFGCQKGKIAEKPAQTPAVVEIRVEPETELQESVFEPGESMEIDELVLLDANRLYESPPKVKISSELDLEEAIMAGEPLGVICYLPAQPEDDYFFFALLDVIEWVNKQLAKVLPE